MLIFFELYSPLLITLLMLPMIVRDRPALDLNGRVKSNSAVKEKGVVVKGGE